MKFGDDPPSDATVSQALAGLKRDGGVVLLLGAATAAHAAICERFLGGDAEQVLVCTEGSIREACREVDPTTVLERPVRTRSASARSQSGSPSEPAEPGSVGADLEAAVRRLAAEGAAVRVCVDTLRPYVDESDRDELVSFIADVRSLAHETGAVVHLHLPAVPEAVPAGLFEPVDAVVELQQIGERTYQQWYLPETGETSSWVDVAPGDRSRV